MDCVVLVLTPPWQEEQLILTNVTVGIGLCRGGGYEAVPAWHAGPHLDGMARRGLPRIRTFIKRARLSSFPLSAIPDEKLLALLRGGLKSGSLVVLREGGLAEAVGDLAKQRRLIRDIERLLRGRLSHNGRQYRLIADQDLNRLPDRDYYEVVRRDEALQILAGIAERAAPGGPQLGALLMSAQAKLTKDWRPPMVPDGLVLLRRIVVVGSHTDMAPAITPSQLRRQLLKTGWIEIEVVDDQGVPYTGPYRVELPDGSIAQGNFDANGLWGNYDIDPGQCTLILPEIPETVLPGTLPATTWIAFKVQDDSGQPIVGRAYRVVLTDGTERTGTTGSGEIRIDPIAPGTCVLYLFLDQAAPAEVPAGLLDGILKDDDGKPIPDYPFEAEFPDGTVIPGQTSKAGVIHLEGCPAAQCTLRFKAA